jgi:hypothetical protein
LNLEQFRQELPQSLSERFPTDFVGKVSLSLCWKSILFIILSPLCPVLELNCIFFKNFFGKIHHFATISNHSKLTYLSIFNVQRRFWQPVTPSARWYDNMICPGRPEKGVAAQRREHRHGGRVQSGDGWGKEKIKVLS